MAQMNSPSIDIVDISDPDLSSFKFKSIQRMWMTGSEYWEKDEAGEEVTRGEKFMFWNGAMEFPLDHAGADNSIDGCGEDAMRPHRIFAAAIGV